MSSSANVPYEVLLDACKFLCRNQLYKLTLTSRWVRKVVLENQMYWPRFRCYRLTLLEVAIRKNIGTIQSALKIIIVFFSISRQIHWLE